jgi:acetyl esterase/lipase
MRLKALAAAAALALTGCTMAAEPPVQHKASGKDGLMIWPDLLERTRPEPDRTIAYGPAQMQKVDLWLPAGKGAHPTVLMVHGGCWQTEIADRRIMNWIAADLRARGIAVWNVDYRGVDRDGGGYPGTFLDTAAAADGLRANSAKFHLDINHLVAVGHSAGGHLALWLAGRQSIPSHSPLRTPDPIRISEVISLGGLPDLEEAARPPGSGCGTEIIEKLVGPPTLSSRDVYADTSVPRLAPLGIRQVLVNGENDRIIPPPYAESYAQQMRAKGDKVEVKMIPRTGHVELIAPETEAWKATAREIEKALHR